MKFSFFILFLFFSLSHTFAQSGWNWPDESPDRAKEKWVYSNDRISGTVSGELNKARPAIQWLLKNNPKLNDALYINAISLYEQLEKTATGAQKIVFRDSILKIYDLRIKHFNNKAENLNRKGLKAWYFFRNDPSRLDELFRLYQEIVELNGNNTNALNLYSYMDLICQQKGRNKLSNEEGLKAYNDIKNILTYNLNKGNDLKLWGAIDEKIEVKMLNCLDLSCEKVIDSYGAGFKENPTVEGAKVIFGLLLKAECVRDSLFIRAAEYLLKEDSSAEIASTLAKSCHLNDDHDRALKYYEIAARLTDKNDDKANDYYQMAHIYKRRDNKVKAREYALKAVNADPSKKEAYELVGDLYFHSFDECASDNDLESKAVFLAAYSMYKKAGAADKMKKVQQGFPSIKTIFEYGKKEGDIIQTGCWINESVTIIKRPQ